MSFVRPAVRARLYRWREALVAAAVAAGGLWLAGQGGLVLLGLGLVVVLAGLASLLAAIRRLRFAGPGDGPGLVEVDEGQIAWFGPQGGGFVARPDLVAVGLVTVAGARHWRLRQQDGQVLLIPVAAQGAGQLFDALNALPGLDGGRLLAALDDAADRPVIWQRPGALNVVRLRP